MKTPRPPLPPPPSPPSPNPFAVAFAQTEAESCPPLGQLPGRLPARSHAPPCGSFKDFLLHHARVLQRDGTGGPFALAGRAPLELVVDWLDKILRNTIGSADRNADLSSVALRRMDIPVRPASPHDPETVHTPACTPSCPPASSCPEAVEIDGVPFHPTQLKGATLAVAGGAQFGKTLLELNLMAYATAVRFLSVGNYLPDRPKVEEIVGQKFRPHVLDLYPWMAQMIQLGKVRNASGKTINRKESYTLTDGRRKSFGNFCAMHKPPTSISLDLALLDEVDDIDQRNIGYIDARMTNSPLHLTCFIGTQRLAGAGQNARLQASSFHVCLVPCPKCRREWCLEEEFPGCIRKRLEPKETKETKASASLASVNSPPDPLITPEMGFDRTAVYYLACPDCGTPLDRDAGRYLARHPERIPQAKLGLRVSQLNISAIPLPEIVAAWYSSFNDPSRNALAAFYCDRLAVPHAAAAQPITPAVLDESRRLGTADHPGPEAPYFMALDRTPALGSCPRVAGVDLGPRCWFWCDELRSPLVSACVWAELISSGALPFRLPALIDALGLQCVFLDAGGEPDLTKRLVLALNGLADFVPPAIPRHELLRTHLHPLGAGLSWDGPRARWLGLRAAAVLFVAGHARGLEQTIGFTQDGRIYPLIKCHRSESIQTAVNDFLTPAQGVIEMVATPNYQLPTPPLSTPLNSIRSLPRARLPQTYIGPGVTQTVLDSHLLNLRKERDPRSGAEDWIDGVENHLGLAKTYARLAQTVLHTTLEPRPDPFLNLAGIRYGPNPGVPHVRTRRLSPFRPPPPRIFYARSLH